MAVLRILITGSRDWDDFDAVYNELFNTINRSFAKKEDVVLVHGHNPKGADAMADYIGAVWGIQVEQHPAQWEHGKKAGPTRNHHMVSLGADRCLAFIKDNSPGASHCSSLAQVAGIPTTITRK